MFRVLKILVLLLLMVVPASAKHYTGSAWVDDTCKYYTGSAWVDCTKNRYDGAAWGEIEAVTAGYYFYWSCDDLPDADSEAATTLTDATGNYKIWRSHTDYPLVDVAGHDGTLGGAWGQDNGYWQNARVPHDFIPTDKAKISMYIYQDSSRSPGSSCYLIKTNDETNNNSFSIKLNSSNNYLYAKIVDGTGAALSAAAPGGLTLDTWHLLECSFNVAAGTISLSIDGTVIASDTGSLSAISAWGTDAEASIGYYADDFGRFDEIYIYHE